MRILIIEDHYYFVRELFNVFAPHHTTGESDMILLTATADPHAADELLKLKWDWILIDHDLPLNVSGWQLLNNSSQYREIDKAKIVAISAIPFNNTRLLQHGAHYAVPKMDVDFASEIKKLIEKEDGENS